ncbi:hypothetical protein [Aeromonas encheleia]
MVSVTGLLASTSANWGWDENRDPLAAADNASAEAIPIPTPANMDLFILSSPEMHPLMLITLAVILAEHRGGTSRWPCRHDSP